MAVLRKANLQIHKKINEKEDPKRKTNANFRFSQAAQCL